MCQDGSERGTDAVFALRNPESTIRSRSEIYMTRFKASNFAYRRLVR